MADYFNAAEYLVTRRVDAGDGDRTAAVGTTTVTYAELDRLIGDAAAAYRTAGLHRDDRVLIVMADDIPMLAAILGAFRAGVVAVPISTMFNGSELGKIMADSGAHLVVCSSEFVDAVNEGLTAAPDVATVVLDGDGDLKVPNGVARWSWPAFVASGAAAAPDTRQIVPTADDSWALWLYTSGTTGFPKAAMHRHANIRHVCETYGDRVLGITRDDRYLSIAKMFFAYGIGNSVFFPLSVGATTLLERRRPTPAIVAERAIADKPTLFGGVPTFFAALLNSDLPDDAFASVRLATSAGEPLPAPLLRRFKERFGVDIIDGIGSTEALHIFLSNRPDHIVPGTTGTAVPGYELRICDGNGELVEDGTPGALQVRGESIALGYWRRTDATRQVFCGEWLITGDTYVRDENGDYTCLGRNSDMFKAGGIWVSPAEVESRLLEHPSVIEVAVVGIADSDGLDKPVAAVVLSASGGQVDEAELITWCRDGMAHFKAPRQIVFAPSLPKTATGKLQRFIVRRQLADGAGQLTGAAS
ncbi:benzoate-CoA ligase family protein [Gordonia sp. (in: high G+C Gram-positive bacteria)]|uniref:benzoate-CoA ligase family protein n=1 Tax=Gordonia sp. (in: high G+C Gram-positive bacteria) TaxID=84139 RepID=UPI003F9BB0BC